jgi:hypothetical protein
MAMTVTAEIGSRRYQRVTKSLEWPMAVLALAVIPALLLDNGSASVCRVLVSWFRCPGDTERG